MRKFLSRTVSNQCEQNIISPQPDQTNILLKIDFRSLLRVEPKETYRYDKNSINLSAPFKLIAPPNSFILLGLRLRGNMDIDTVENQLLFSTRCFLSINSQFILSREGQDEE